MRARSKLYVDDELSTNMKCSHPLKGFIATTTDNSILQIISTQDKSYGHTTCDLGL